MVLNYTSGVSGGDCNTGMIATNNKVPPRLIVFIVTVFATIKITGIEIARIIIKLHMHIAVCVNFGD